MRQELGVDVELAHAPRDQLGELAAEVEHDDRVRLLGRLGLDALRWSGVERLLEVRLDLGVVGGEHAVAGVRCLAVDRAAPIRRALLVGLRLLGQLWSVYRLRWLFGCASGASPSGIRRSPARGNGGAR